MLVMGIDEVGRGCWAGPLVAGAVVLGRPIKGLKDSKQLTKLQRELLAEQIHARALAVGIGWVAPQDIDRLGVTASVRLAMQLAREQIALEVDEIILDGAFNFFSDDAHVRAIAKADASIPTVSAASIIAKVARDQFMTKIADIYPGYGFASHVGYGTSEHQRALKNLGICELHRRSYKPIQAMLGATP